MSQSGFGEQDAFASFESSPPVQSAPCPPSPQQPKPELDLFGFDDAPSTTQQLPMVCVMLVCFFPFSLCLCLFLFLSVSLCSLCIFISYCLSLFPLPFSSFSLSLFQSTQSLQPTMTGAAANVEQVQKLQSEKDKAEEKLTGAEKKLSLLEEEKLRIQKVLCANLKFNFISCFYY